MEQPPSSAGRAGPLQGPACPAADAAPGMPWAWARCCRAPQPERGPQGKPWHGCKRGQMLLKLLMHCLHVRL